MELYLHNLIVVKSFVAGKIGNVKVGRRGGCRPGYPVSGRGAARARRRGRGWMARRPVGEAQIQARDNT
jgi:hypothetical protein